MVHTSLDSEIQARITTFLSELSLLVKRSALEAVHEALGDAAAVQRGPGRPRKLSLRVRKPGQRLEEIGRALRTDTATLKRPIANLLAAKKLSTKGRKRGTKYFVK
jgi:hypothetical protein